ncbi:MAG: hypothetical protein MJ090_04380 [Clostridia bacterium]|nr:hypothetical protein [Clostridia bacterium]
MIEASFECQQMTLEYVGIVEDSVRFLKIHFNFDEYWDGAEKTAVFEHNGEKYLVALCEGNSMYLGNNTCYVPQEVIKATSFFVSVFAQKNNTVITSSSEPVTVEESNENKNIPSDPTPSSWTQMLGIANYAKEVAEAVEERADSGEFDGVGVVSGGTENQILAKASNEDYDTKWVTPVNAYSKTESDAVYVKKTVKINEKPLENDISLTANDVGAYEKPSNGIPKSDLSSGVKSSLAKADTALQEHQSLTDYAEKIWVEDKGYLTEHQSLVNYYTKGQVDNLIPTVDSVYDFESPNPQSGTALGSAIADLTLYIDTKDAEKQDKLIAGDNITIDENNVISSSGSGGSLEKWELLGEITHDGSTSRYFFSQDSNGNPLNLKAASVLMDNCIINDISDEHYIGINFNKIGKTYAYFQKNTAITQHAFISFTKKNGFNVIEGSHFVSENGGFANLGQASFPLKEFPVKYADSQSNLTTWLWIDIDSGSILNSGAKFYVYGIKA